MVIPQLFLYQNSRWKRKVVVYLCWGNKTELR